MKKKWTLDVLKELASNYDTKSQFCNNNPAAYQAAFRSGLLDEVTKNLKATYKNWTLEEVAEIAKKYDKKTDFKRNEPKAYDWAIRSKKINIISEHMNKGNKAPFTKKVVLELVKAYEDYYTFTRCESSAYAHARKNEYLNEIKAILPHTRKKYTETQIRSEATKYTSRADFKRGSFKHYDQARYMDYLDDVCNHMGGPKGTDNNCIYLWKVISSEHKNLYKFGVTSSRLGDERIKNVASFFSFDFEIIVMGETKIQATRTEKKIKHLGIKPDFLEKENGYSEFRFYTDAELTRVIKIIKDSIGVIL